MAGRIGSHEGEHHMIVRRWSRDLPVPAEQLAPLIDGLATHADGL
jgi:hypothetical protein